MKRVDIAYGILERLNDLLGSVDSGDGSDLSLTGWSVQSAFIENLSRIAKGFAGGSSDGHIGWGLDLTASGTSGYVAEGVGFTASGEIVYWNGNNVPSSILKPSSDVNDVKLYLKYTSVRLSEPEGRESDTSTKARYDVGEPVKINIDNSSTAADCFTNTSSEDTILVATYDISGGSIINIVSNAIGFAPINGGDVRHDKLTVGDLYVDNLATFEDLTVQTTLTAKDTITDTLLVNGTSSFSSAATFSAGVSGNVTGDLTGNVAGNVTGNVTGVVTATNGTNGSFILGTDTNTITVVNGIITSIV